MAWFNEENPETLNYILAGNTGSGFELLRTVLAIHPDMVCHGDVLSDNGVARKQNHEDYFGDSGKVPDWFLPTCLSAEQYLNNKLFDNTRRGESAVGVQVSYWQLQKYDMWEYVINKCRQGDFCLVHVKRNPVACFIDAKRGVNHESDQIDNLFFNIDPAELTQFVRKHLAFELKVDRLCCDRAVILYEELIIDLRNMLKKLMKHLGVDYSPSCIPNMRMAIGRDIRSHVQNWKTLTRSLPNDVLHQLNEPTLF